MPVRREDEMFFQDRYFVRNFVTVELIVCKKTVRHRFKTLDVG